MFLIVLLVMLFFPDAAWAEGTDDTFRSGGIGYTIVQVVKIGVFCGVVSFVLEALNLATFSKVVKLLGTISIAFLVLEALIKFLVKIKDTFHIDLLMEVAKCLWC